MSDYNASHVHHQLVILSAIIDVLRRYENQDKNYILDATSDILDDIKTGAIIDLRVIVRQYCDILDGPEDVNRIIQEITNNYNGRMHV